MPKDNKQNRFPGGNHIDVDYSPHDPNVFAKQFNENWRPVYQYIRRYGFTVDEAMDVMQNTFIRAYRYGNRVRIEDGFKKWIMSIARSEALLQLKNNKNKRPCRFFANEDVEIADPNGLDGIDNILDVDEYRRFREKCNLTEAEKVVLDHIVDRVHFDVIQDKLTLTRAQVKSIAKRASRQWKSYLQSEVNDA